MNILITKKINIKQKNNEYVNNKTHKKLNSNELKKAISKY